MISLLSLLVTNPGYREKRAIYDKDSIINQLTNEMDKKPETELT